MASSLSGGPELGTRGEYMGLGGDSTAVCPSGMDEEEELEAVLAIPYQQ